jgi:hypothetical protein
MARGKKTGGRKAGTPNKATAKIRESLQGFLLSQQPDIEKAFKKLSPNQKVYAYTRLLPFLLPQYSSLSLDANQLPTEYLELVYENFKKKHGISDDTEGGNN